MGLSRLSFMLPFVPFALAMRKLSIQDENLIFVLNAIAIIPLTAILTRTTENISESIGVALGALLNITMGNMVELFML
jgi:Ca2+:H+ antiporter